MSHVPSRLLLPLLLLAGCYVGPGAAPPPPRATSTSAVVAEIVASANEARARNGVARLAEDARLAAAAQDFAVELARRQTLTHTSSRQGYATLLDRIDRAGGSAVRAGENVGMMSPRANVGQEAVRMWLASDGHRRNLLNAAYTHTGAGAARAGNGAWYFVQVYATPARR